MNLYQLTLTSRETNLYVTLEALAASSEEAAELFRRGLASQAWAECKLREKEEIGLENVPSYGEDSWDTADIVLHDEDVEPCSLGGASWNVYVRDDDGKALVVLADSGACG